MYLKINKEQFKEGRANSSSNGEISQVSNLLRGSRIKSGPSLVSHQSLQSTAYAEVYDTGGSRISRGFNKIKISFNSRTSTNFKEIGRILLRCSRATKILDPRRV